MCFQQLEAPPSRAMKGLHPSAQMASGQVYILFSSTRSAPILHSRAPRLRPHLGPYLCALADDGARLEPSPYLMGQLYIRAPAASNPDQRTPERTSARRPQMTDHLSGIMLSTDIETGTGTVHRAPGRALARRPDGLRGMKRGPRLDASLLSHA